MIKKLTLCLLLAAGLTQAMAQSMGEVSKQLKIFNQMYKVLNEYYVDTLDAEKNITTAMRAMLSSLDPYTEFYNAEGVESFNSQTTGKYAGVGAIIHYYKAADRCVIYELYEGMPAAKDGLKVGDIILSIDGKDMGTRGTKPIAEYTSHVSSSLRGDAGTVARVRVKRPGVADTLTIDVTRANVQLPSVPYYGMVANDVGYILLETFSPDCSKDVRTALRDLKGRGAKSLILDLRNNGGGMALEAVRIVNLFVPKGKLILKMKGKYESANNTYSTQDVPEDQQMPLVVLVNEGSASASEIVCGSIQDLDRGVILGERTYGKGLVQQTHNLPYNTMVKLTTSHYYIPSGRCIQALDYSHRSTDGEAYRMPDSLTHVFYTEAGRAVKDGGGITPDITVKSDTMPIVLNYLRASDEYFDYLNHYCNTHPSIDAANTFAVSDADYDEFVEWIGQSGFKPERPSSKLIEQMKGQLKIESAPQEAYDRLAEFERSLTPNISSLLIDVKAEMRLALSADLCARYYYTKGLVQNQLICDSQLNAALKLLGDSKTYHKTLKK